MFDKMKRLIMQHHKTTDIGPPIPPRPDIPGSPTTLERHMGQVDWGGSDTLGDACRKRTNGIRKDSSFEDLQSLGCYYDRVEHHELGKIMNPYLYDTGAYIIRRSNTNPNALTISVVHTKSHIYHFKVLPQNDMYEVTKNLKFRTIHEIIEYFKSHDIPGSEIQDLKLTTPIKKKRKARSVGDRPLTALPSIPRRVSEPEPIRDRDRQPTPPPSDSEDHKYTEVTEQDKLAIIRQLCREQDRLQQEQQVRQKCQCGLYYDESVLIHDWMMHRSIKPGCNGRIFFVNQKTNETAWRLPQQVKMNLRSVYPDRYEIYQRLQNESQ